MKFSSVPSSFLTSSSSLSCSVKLSTIVNKINLVVQNMENQSIILDFYNYMQENGSSENHQVNRANIRYP